MLWELKENFPGRWRQRKKGDLTVNQTRASGRTLEGVWWSHMRDGALNQENVG